MAGKGVDAYVRLKGDDKTRAAFASARRNVQGLKTDISALGNVAQIAMGNVLANAVGKAVGAVKNLVSETFRLNDRMHKLSISTGISVNVISTLRHAAGFAGTTMEELVNGLANLDHALVAGQKDLQEKVRDLKALGINADEFVQMNFDEKISRLADAFANLNNAAVRTNLSRNLLGGGARGFLQAMEEGAEAWEKWKESAKEAGVLFDESWVTQFADFNDDIYAMQESFRGLGNVVLTEFMEPLTEGLKIAANAMRRLFEWLDKRKEEAIVVRIGTIKSMMMAARGDVLSELIMEKWELESDLEALRSKPGPGFGDKKFGGPRGGETGVFGGKNKRVPKPTGPWSKIGENFKKSEFDWLSPVVPDVKEFNTAMGEAIRKQWELQDALKAQAEPVSELKQMFDDLKFAVEGWGRSFADRLLEGELNFKSFIDAMLREMIRMQVAQQSSKLFGMIGDVLGSAIGNFFGGGAQAKSLALGSSREGYGPSYGGFGTRPAGVGSPLRSLATGSHLITTDGWYRLERNERVVPAGMTMSGGGGGKTIVNINNQAGAQVSAESEIDSNGDEIVNVMVRNSVGENLSAGTLDDAFGANFGLARGGVQVG